MKTYIKLVIAIVILAALVYALFAFDIARPDAPGQTASSTADAVTADLIHVAAPAANSAVSSPVTLLGEARGPWFFEASFPVKVIGADGKVLASGPAAAQGEWMTSDFVQFKAQLQFDPKGNASGVIRFEKDNPSGDPARDMHVDIPVTFLPPTAISTGSSNPQ